MPARRYFFGCLAAAALWMTLGAQAPAYAYLDPGSGSALVYGLAALLGAGGFAVKGLAYRLTGRKIHDPARDGRHRDIAIFSEGRMYWGTFRPVVDALRRRGRAFQYLTLDVDDPALEIDDPLMDARYVGDGDWGLARVARVRARLFVATTPNIGTPGYPLAVPRHVERLVHIPHAHGPSSMYRRHGLDAYHALLTPSPAYDPAYRFLEQKRGLAPRELVPVGIPYFDGLRARAKALPPRNAGPADRDGRRTVLVAPTWGEAGNLALCGASVIPALLERNFRVILRPHPQSYRTEPELAASVFERFAGDARVEIDRAVDGLPSMARADAMVSDTSGVRFDFAFLFERPVVTMRRPSPAMFERDVLGPLGWIDEAAARIGAVVDVDAGDAAGAGGAVARAVEQALGRDGVTAASLARFRDESVVTPPDGAGEAVAAWLESALSRMSESEASIPA